MNLKSSNAIPSMLNIMNSNLYLGEELFALSFSLWIKRVERSSLSR
jgi:hypothetical protein